MNDYAAMPLEQHLHFGGRPYVIRDMAPGDAPEVLRLFEEAFGQQPGRDWFEWKYGAGRSGALGLWDPAGRLMAHCAGIPRSIAWRGGPVAGLQSGDVMVSREIRGLVMRKGPFQQVCSGFFATRVGSAGSGRPYRFAWGFPNQRHLRLGVTLGLYWDAGSISELRWPARRQRLSPWYSCVPLAVDAADFERQVDATWQAMAADLQDYVLGVRDSNYVRWRFLARPDRQYQLFALRRRMTGKMLALVVMRIGEGKAELLDVVGPRSAFPHAVRAHQHGSRHWRGLPDRLGQPSAGGLATAPGLRPRPAGSLAIIRNPTFPAYGG